MGQGREPQPEGGQKSQAFPQSVVLGQSPFRLELVKDRVGDVGVVVPSRLASHAPDGTHAPRRGVGDDLQVRLGRVRVENSLDGGSSRQQGPHPTKCRAYPLDMYEVSGSPQGSSLISHIMS